MDAFQWIIVGQIQKFHLIVSSLRIVMVYDCLIFFGGKWEWAENTYENFIQLGVALTNAIVIHNQLREEDKKRYTCILNL